MQQLRLYLMICVLIGMDQASWAKEVQHLFESTRNYGRGRTFVAAFDSDEASRFNPATISEADVTFQLRWIDFDLFFAEKGFNEVMDATSSSSTTFLETAKDLFKGTNLNGRGQLSLFSFRVGGFEASPFFVAKGHADLRNPALPDADYEADASLGLNLSYSMALSKQFAIGLTLRPIHRWYLGGEAGVTDLLDTSNLQDLTTVVYGFGLGLDVGLVYSPTKTFRLGFVVHNVGDTEYFQDYGSEPPAIMQTINAGMLTRFDLFGGHLDVLADLQGLVNRDGVNLLRLVHLGLEQGWSIFTRDHDLGLLMGVNEGYFGGGFFLDAFFARLDFSMYGVELGQYPGQRVDRRMALTLKSSMTF